MVGFTEAAITAAMPTVKRNIAVISPIQANLFFILLFLLIQQQLHIQSCCAPIKLMRKLLFQRELQELR
jgi:hypothetical protein